MTVRVTVRVTVANSHPDPRAAGRQRGPVGSPRPEARPDGEGPAGDALPGDTPAERLWGKRPLQSAELKPVPDDVDHFSSRSEMSCTLSRKVYYERPIEMSCTLSQNANHPVHN